MYFDAEVLLLDVRCCCVAREPFRSWWVEAVMFCGWVMLTTDMVYCCYPYAFDTLVLIDGELAAAMFITGICYTLTV